MTWISILIAIAVLSLLLVLRRSRRVPRKTAVEYLRKGAVIVDVRSAGEFTARHLPRAVNIPLSEIEAVIGRKVKDKNQVVLLHCQSGRRALEARRRLKAVGYAKAFNLGSYDRAT